MNTNQVGNNNINSRRLVKFMPIIIASIIMVIVFSTYNGISILTYANSNSTALRSLTNASSLEVLLVPLSNVSREEMQFRVGFLQPNTNQLQRHVDFNFIIIKDGKEVFRASNQTGQPNIPLHSIPGTMDIPIYTYDFQKSGEYAIKIPVVGILFNPIKPEEADFRIRY